HLDDARVAEGGTRAGDPAEAIGRGERLANEDGHAAAVVNLRVADFAVQKQKAVVVLVDRSFGVVVTADVAAASDSVSIVGERCSVGGALQGSHFDGPYFGVGGVIGAEGLIEFAIDRVLFEVGQDFHNPAYVNALRLVADRSVGVRHARRQVFVVKFVIVKRKADLRDVVEALH